MTLSTDALVDYGTLSDADLARLCVARDRGAIMHVITANNQRLYRLARGI